MTNQKRKAVPKDTEANVLIRCRRRCCLCAFWNNDNGQKDGQIAHIDRNPANSEVDNLAYLCFPHHNQYDAKQLQGKNITPKELHHARDKLYREINPESEAVFSVTLTLNREFEEFSEQDQQEFFEFVQQILEKRGNINVTQKGPGSVNLTIELNAVETSRLFTAFEAGAFDQYDLVDARIDNVQSPPPASVEFWQTYLGGICPYVVPKDVVLNVIGNPDRQQHLRGGKDASLLNSRCSLFVKRFDGPNGYTALVVSSFIDSHIVVGFAVRIYPSDVEHSLDLEPVAVLRAFLDKYGVKEAYTGLGAKRLFFAVPLKLPSFIRNGPMAIGYLHSLRKHPANLDPRDIEFLNLHFYEPKKRRVFIELAFGISLSRYAHDLLRHDVILPAKFTVRKPKD